MSALSSQKLDLSASGVAESVGRRRIESVVLSIGVHAVLVFSAVYITGIGIDKDMKPEQYLDLGYEAFDAPPPPVPEVRKVMRSPSPDRVVETKAIPDNSPKEVQDEKGEIAGTQAAAKETNIGSDSNGTAASTPYYKIKPKYPKAALISGIEGWVMFEIDISETGEVEDVRVIDGEQRNTFQSEAKRAVAQWKYRPFLDSTGKPYKKLAHQVRVDFKLNEVSENSVGL